MDIAQGNIGKEGAYEVDIVGGKMIVTAKLDTAGFDHEQKNTLDLNYVLDKVAEKLPTWAQPLMAVVKGALALAQ